MQSQSKITQITAIVGTVVTIITLFISKEFRYFLSQISIPPITIIFLFIIAAIIIIIAPLPKRVKKDTSIILVAFFILWISWQIYSSVHPFQKSEIVIAEFNGEKATKKADIAGRIYDNLIEELKKTGTTGISIKKMSKPIDNLGDARDEGSRLKARTSLVIWGEYDDYGIRSHFVVTRKLLKEELKPISLPEIPVGIETKELRQFSLYITKDLPREMTCLAAFMIGLCNYLEERYGEAIEYFNIAITKTAPETKSISRKIIYQYMAYTYTSMKQYDHAISAMENIITLDPMDSLAYRQLGLIYEIKGEYDDAIAFYKKATELNSREGLAYLGLVHCYYHKEQWKDVIVYCEKMIKLHQINSELYDSLGMAYKKMGLHKEAEKAFERSRYCYIPKLDFSPWWVVVLDYLLIAFLMFLLLLLVIKAIIKRKMPRVVLLSVIGLFLIFLMSLVYPFVMVEIYNNLGLMHLSKGEYDKAIECDRKAIQLNPKLAVAYNNLGVNYHYKGEYDKAIEYYKRAIQLNPKLAIAYSNLGANYHDKGEYDKAIECYKKAIQLNPKLDIAYSNLGESYQYKGEYDKSIEYCKKAIELNPKIISTYNYLGFAYTAKGMEAEAEKAFKKAEELIGQY